MSQIIKVATQELEHKINKALTEENEFVQTAVLTQISATFLDQCQKCVQPNTYKNDGLFIKKFIDDFGHDTIINNISIQSLKRYFNNDCLTNGAITTLNIFKLQYLTGLRVQDAIKEDDKTYLDIDHSLFF